MKNPKDYRKKADSGGSGTHKREREPSKLKNVATANSSSGMVLGL